MPTLEEVIDVALPHLQEAEDAIVSFGQGCEGSRWSSGDFLKTPFSSFEKRPTGGQSISTPMGVFPNGSGGSVRQALTAFG